MMSKAGGVLVNEFGIEEIIHQKKFLMYLKTFSIISLF